MRVGARGSAAGRAIRRLTSQDLSIVSVVRPWRSDFDLTVLDYSSQQVTDDARRHSRHLFWPGLGVWITRDGELRARFKEWGYQVETPTLTAHLIDDDGNMRIVGRLSWTQLQSWQLIYAIIAATSLVIGTSGLFQDLASGLIILACGVGFLGLLLVDLKVEPSTRALEERMLKEGLLEAFGSRAPTEDAEFAEEN